ncbi:MAG TPA: sigma-70 family RNA polymerase sigma factor [Verrucomicrobiae bacterium]|nr:sigma-70 family RNA polymerase sigma factor [Verrucomicrobiae bacterium]
MKPNEESKDLDEELLRAARNAPEGDLRAFEELVQHHQKRILANCRYLTRDESIAEDLAQEVFVKAFFGLRAFEGRSSFRHWLQTIKVHHCLNHLKKREGKATLAMDEEAVERYEQLHVQPVAAEELEAVERRKRIDGILNAMPATLRIPLIMRDMDELSYEEVAASLGIGLSAVKMRIKRAREQFRRRYRGEEAALGAQTSR